MAKHYKDTSARSEQKADALARATQRPGQSKAQTRLIAAGIKKGIEEYKKQQSVKTRALDKERKTLARKLEKLSQRSEQPLDAGNDRQKKESEGNLLRKFSGGLPWLLLLISWAVFLLKASLYK